MRNKNELKNMLKRNPDLMATRSGRKYLMWLATPTTESNWSKKLKAIVNYAREENHYPDPSGDQELQQEE